MLKILSSLRDFHTCLAAAMSSGKQFPKISRYLLCVYVCIICVYVCVFVCVCILVKMTSITNRCSSGVLPESQEVDTYSGHFWPTEWMVNMANTRQPLPRLHYLYPSDYNMFNLCVCVFLLWNKSNVVKFTLLQHIMKALFCGIFVVVVEITGKRIFPKKTKKKTWYHRQYSRDFWGKRQQNSFFFFQKIKENYLKMRKT